MIRNNFIITTPMFNASPWIEACIDSIINQTYKNWVLCIIDDVSTDSSFDIIQKFNDHSQITIIKNIVKQGALLNIKTCINTISTNPNDIIVNLDGDDKFFDKSVLDYLNQIYQDKKIWMTYGEYQTTSGDPSQNATINDTRNYRRNKIWSTSHLRTYKRILWNRIRDEDFKDADGNYFLAAPDLAIIYPIIEMCGLQHIRFIQNKILVIYNDHNPLCEFKINVSLLEKTREYIWNKRVYDEIVGEI